MIRSGEDRGCWRRHPVNISEVYTSLLSIYTKYTHTHSLSLLTQIKHCTHLHAQMEGYSWHLPNQQNPKPVQPG